MMGIGTMELFLLLVAVIYTVVGYHFGKRSGLNQGAEEMLYILEENDFLKVKSRTTDEHGNERVEYSKVNNSK